MKQSVYFCKSWFRAKKRPTEVWEASQAMAAHAAEKPYTALVGSMEQPYCFLEISKNVVGVGFLDGRLREVLTYAFQQVDSERLFLTMATHREFDGDTDKVKSGITYLFERTGEVAIRRESFDPHVLEEKKSQSSVDDNYSEIPGFGDYEDLIRVERGVK